METDPGSSPLARGLRRPPEEERSRRRIIPARAGFTVMRPLKSWRIMDHPRSRGVYWLPSPPVICTPGSSPLARGLRDRGGEGRLCRRIIPARAGFTRRAAIISRARSDHPRSRGVYTTDPCGSKLRGGSSPLARGLLPHAGDDGGGGGIIPARAGFTGTSSPTPSPARDHPRSRGVYAATVRQP